MDAGQVCIVHFPLYADITVFAEDMEILITVGHKRFVPSDLLSFVVRNLVVMDILST